MRESLVGWLDRGQMADFYFFEHPYLERKPMDMSSNLSGCLVLEGFDFPMSNLQKQIN